MKREIKYFMLLAAMPLACFCTKNTEFVQPVDGDVVTITASIPTTKVSLTPGEDPALALAWEEGDQIVVEGTSSSTFTVSNIVNAHKADFTGAPVSGDEFAVYYPGKAILTRSYEGQIQDGNASTAHLEYNAMVEGLSSYENFTFDKVNGAVKLVVNVPAGVTTVSAISIMVLNADGDGQSVFYKTNDVEGGKMPAIRLDFTKGTAPVDNVLTAYAMVSWNPVELASGNRLAIKLYTPEKSYRKIITVTKGTTISGGETFIVDLSSAAALNEYAIAGTGTESDPYLLYDSEDMEAVRDSLHSDRITYFKMMADIDMKGINWVGGNQDKPYTQHIDFDGCGHKIINLTCNNTGKYTGLVGVLSGRAANVTFEKPSVIASTHVGIVCSYAGTEGTKPAIIENVNIINGQITQKGGNHTGLVFGHSNVAGCEFTNITVSGTINQNGIGDSGFIGGAQNFAATFTNCHASGTLTIKSTLSAAETAKNICSGGIQGYSAGSTYNNCSFSNGTINGGRLCGGIVGYDTQTTLKMTDCHVSDATINTTKIGSAPGEVVGGIIGWVEGGTVSKCSFDGSITAEGKEVGGIVGHVKAGTVEYCYCKGSVSGNNDIGGIVGILAAGTSGNKNAINDCYSTANITNRGQNAGGIAGEIQGYDKVSYCFATGEIQSVRVAGGVIGRASGTKWGATSTYNDEVLSCHAYNSSIKSTQTSEGGGSGTIIGYCSVQDTYTKCYRHPDFGDNDPTQTRFYCANEPNELPVNQGKSITPSSHITAGIVGTTSAKGKLTMKYTYPFHGNKSAYSTVSTLVVALEWNTDIWDIDTSKEYPTLKNNPEPAE